MSPYIERLEGLLQAYDLLLEQRNDTILANNELKEENIKLKVTTEANVKTLQQEITFKNEIIHNLSANENKSSQQPVIDLLKTQLEFVKNEIASKDKIIDILINDKVCIKSTNTENIPIKDTTHSEPFKYPKKSSKTNYMYNDKDNTIAVSNRFDMLNATSINNCMDEYGDDFNTTFDSDHDTRKQTRRTNRSITIVGDSLVKDVKSFNMKKATAKGDKLYIKSFPGATTDCMTDYIKPSLKYDPDLVIIHCGSNDLRSQKTPDIIADDIIKLASKSKTNTNDVVISGIIARNDEYNVKGKQVNEHLTAKCDERHIFL